MDQTNLHSASHSTWNQITTPQFHILYSFSFHSPHDSTPINIGTQSYGTATTSYSYNSHMVPSSHNGSQNVGSHVPPIHNQHRPIQEADDDDHEDFNQFMFMDSLVESFEVSDMEAEKTHQEPDDEEDFVQFMFMDSLVDSFEVSNMEAENTHTSHDSVIDRSTTPSNSNLGPQVPDSSYMNVPNNHLQHESRRIFLVPMGSWDEESSLQEDYVVMEFTNERQQFVFLGEEMGDISTGLSEETISRNLKIRTRVSSANNESPNEEGFEICVICQGEYEKNERIGILHCRHEYHEDCIKKWLVQKNVCPICKGTALTVEKKN